MKIIKRFFNYSILKYYIYYISLHFIGLLFKYNNFERKANSLHEIIGNNLSHNLESLVRTYIIFFVGFISLIADNLFKANVSCGDDYCAPQSNEAYILTIISTLLISYLAAVLMYYLMRLKNFIANRNIKLSWLKNKFFHIILLIIFTPIFIMLISIFLVF